MSKKTKSKLVLIADSACDLPEDIIEEYDATSVVPPNCIANIDDFGNIIIQLRSL